MKHFLFMLLFVVVGFMAGLYLSQHVTDFFPQYNTAGVKPNSSIVMHSG